MASDKVPWTPFDHYLPSAVLAAIFAGLFGITTLWHVWQLWRKRTWYFIPLVVGGFLEVIGFIARILSRPNNFSILGPFLIQAIFILIAPTLFAASIYIVLGRIILLVNGERYSWLRQKHVTAVFVAGDVISLNLQSTGGGLTGGRSAAALQLGRWLIIIGLFAQLAFFGLFIAVAGVFHYRLIHDKPVAKYVSFRWLHWLRWFRCWKQGKKDRPSSSTYATTDTPSRTVDISQLPWKRHIFVLYVTSILILIRSIFRAAEYIQGQDGYLLSKEVFLYAFDAALMLIVMVLFNMIHPSQITELYQQRLSGTSVDGGILELQSTRERLVPQVRT